MKNSEINAWTLFSGVCNSVREFWDVAKAAWPDPDCADRRAVYGHVAGLLANRLHCPRGAALGAVQTLCGEDDKTLLSASEIPDAALLEQARAFLVIVGVEYEFADTNKVERVTTVSYLDGNQPMKRWFTDVIEWDFVPREVREERLRRAATRVGFELYPRDNNSNL